MHRGKTQENECLSNTYTKDHFRELMASPPGQQPPGAIVKTIGHLET